MTRVKQIRAKANMKDPKCVWQNCFCFLVTKFISLLLLSALQIADSMKPHPIVINTLKNLAKVIPTWKIVPSEDFLVLAIKSPQLREEVNCIFANVYLDQVHA